MPTNLAVPWLGGWKEREGSGSLTVGTGKGEKVWGEGRIRATKGWISVDRGSKATLPLTIPRRVFKSSAKDSTRRLMGIVLQGGPRGSSATRA